MPRFGTFEIQGHSMYIYGAPREENPPHFHLVKNGETICRYGILDFRNLDNVCVSSKVENDIKWYWSSHKENMLKYFCQINPKLCESQG